MWYWVSVWWGFMRSVFPVVPILTIMAVLAVGFGILAYFRAGRIG